MYHDDDRVIENWDVFRIKSVKTTSMQNESTKR